jgi:hypothetical protein
MALLVPYFLSYSASLLGSVSHNTLLPLEVVGTEMPSEGKPAGPGKLHAPFLPVNKEEDGSFNV